MGAGPFASLKAESELEYTPDLLTHVVISALTGRTISQIDKTYSMLVAEGRVIASSPRIGSIIRFSQ